MFFVVVVVFVGVVVVFFFDYLIISSLLFIDRGCSQGRMMVYAKLCFKNVKTYFYDSLQGFLKCFTRTHAHHISILCAHK